MSVDDFVRVNADPIFLYQERMWEYLEAEGGMDSRRTRTPVMTSSGRESVEFITTERGTDLIVAHAVALDESAEIASLILQRTPKYEILLTPEERGVAVSHELYPMDDHELASRIAVDGSSVDVETTTRTYRLDLSGVDPKEAKEARKVLLKMHRYGGFQLDLR